MKSAPHIVMNADVGGSHMTTVFVNTSKQEFILENLIKERVIAHSKLGQIINNQSHCILSTIKVYQNFNKDISKIKNVAKFDSLFCLKAKSNKNYLEKIEYNKPNYKPN